MLTERINRRRRDRVHGVLPNELFDVNHVAIVRILGARAGPEQALCLRAFGRKGFPARAAEKFLILLVSEPGVCDGHLASNALEQRLVARICNRLELLLDPAVYESIDAANEKTRHAGDVADVLALGSASFESGKECFGNLFVCGLRKEQRDIDINAVFESLAYGGEAFGRARDFDHDVRAIHGLPQASSFGERGFGIEAKERRNLQADVTVAPLRLRIYRFEYVARILHVANRDFFEDAVGVELLRFRRQENIVVELASRDGLLENRRVGRHPAQSVVINVFLQLTAREQVPANVVHPGRLPVGQQALQRIRRAAGRNVGNCGCRGHRSSPSLAKIFETLLYAQPGWRASRRERKSSFLSFRIRRKLRFQRFHFSQPPHMPPRIPGSLFTATLAPTPLPQIRTPRSAFPSRTARPTASAKSG